MMQYDTNLTQSLQQAAIHLEKGDLAAVKQTYFKALHESPHQVHIRELLRSTIRYLPSVDLSRFADEFEQAVVGHATTVVTNAIGGWIYGMAIDNQFLDANLERPAVEGSVAKATDPPGSEPTGDAREAGEILSSLLATSDIRKRWDAVCKLVDADEPVLREDSFPGLEWNELPAALLSGQRPDRLNFVILGGGCIGLALANALKWTFRDKVDVLIIENRIERRHRKLPYSRHWLTHIPTSVLTGVYDLQVTQLLSQFGRPGFMGATLAVFETLLLVSNKKLGVRFLYDDAYDLSFLEQSNTHIVFDATGGRLRPPREGWTKGTLGDGPPSLQVTTPAMQQYGRGHYPHGITRADNVPSMQIEVKKFEDYYRPTLNGAPLTTAEFKLTHVPIELYEVLLDHVRQQNHDSLFYIWPGNLLPELNEVLVLINLDQKGLTYLTSLVREKTSLIECIERGLLESKSLDPRIIEFVRFLQKKTDKFSQIGIEPPFLFAPRVKWLSGKFDRLWGKLVVPVGDSVMTGNPKSGNGLGSHLSMLLRLHDAAVLLYGLH